MTSEKINKTPLITCCQKVECGFLSFKINNKDFNLTVGDLTKNAKASLQRLAEFVAINNQGTPLLALAKDYAMHVAPEGDYIYFTHQDEELVYWDHQELTDDPVNVLGAIASSATQPALIKKAITL